MEVPWWPAIRGFLLLCTVWLLSSTATILGLLFCVRKPRFSLLRRLALAMSALLLLVAWYVEFRLPGYLVANMRDWGWSFNDVHNTLFGVGIALWVLLGYVCGLLWFAFSFDNGPGKSNKAGPS
jgi:hypothetical protein